MIIDWLVMPRWSFRIFIDLIIPRNSLSGRKLLSFLTNSEIRGIYTGKGLFLADFFGWESQKRGLQLAYF